MSQEYYDDGYSYQSRRKKFCLRESLTPEIPILSTNKQMTSS